VGLHVRQIMMAGLVNEAVPITRYAYKASLIGSAHQFELTDAGLSWQIAGRSGVWPYTDIAAVRLSYRPVSMQSRRFRADIENTNGRRIAVLSTTWQTVSLMTPQDHGYRAFITELHRRMAEAGSKAALIGGIGPKTYATALVLLTLLAIAMVGLLARALLTGEFIGALFLVGFAVLFAWQIGGFVKRNRPRSYSFGDLPDGLLP
jgi:hypothetical protein